MVSLKQDLSLSNQTCSNLFRLLVNKVYKEQLNFTWKTLANYNLLVLSNKFFQFTIFGGSNFVSTTVLIICLFKWFRRVLKKKI